MPRLIRAETFKFKQVDFNLREFHERRNTILIVRDVGGAGDILAHRMIFEDFKKQNPDLKLHFACPKKYHELVEDHLYVDKVLDSATVEYQKYLMFYNTSSACSRYEMAISPRSDMNRSDIWANHCGLQLTRHEMHIKLSDNTIEYGKKALQQINKEEKPCVLLAPISAMHSKNLQFNQLAGLVEGLRMRGCYVCASHNQPIPELTKLDVPVIGGMSMKNWMGIVNAADYVVSVDTGCFHLACGLKKPTVGIFTFADGKTYGKWYQNWELVQKHRDNGDWACGPCYNASNCPKSNKSDKPCLTEITVGMIMDGVDRLFSRFPFKNNLKVLR